VLAAGGSITALANVTVQSSMVANNSIVGILAGSFSTVTVSNTTIANNGIGLEAQSESALLQVSGSTVSGNGTGWSVVSGGQVISSGNNSFGNKAADVAPPISPTKVTAPV